MKTTTLGMIGMLVILSACGKVSETETANGPVPIEFTFEQPDFTIDTKAVTETTQATLTSVQVSAYSRTQGKWLWSNVTFTQGSNGRFTGSMFWPSTDQDLAFYAANYDIKTTDNSFTVKPTTCGKDIVCGYKGSSVQYLGLNTIELKHIFTRIGTTVVSSRDSYEISGLSLKITPLVPGSNTSYDIGSSTWSNPVADTPVTLSSEIGTKQNDFMMIPGKYKFSATWTASKKGYTQTYTNVESAEFELKPGYKYGINCTVGGNASDLELSFTVENWKSDSINIVF